MPTTRQYQFDVDTKRYLNRVNTYRSLNGLADIQKSDAADIDNFVIGLKDLGIWVRSTVWIFSKDYNIGTGSNVISLNRSEQNSILINSPVWTESGIQTSTANSYINLNYIWRLQSIGSIILGYFYHANRGSFTRILNDWPALLHYVNGSQGSIVEGLRTTYNNVPSQSLAWRDYYNTSTTFNKWNQITYKQSTSIRGEVSIDNNSFLIGTNSTISLDPPFLINLSSTSNSGINATFSYCIIMNDLDISLQQSNSIKQLISSTILKKYI